VGNGERRKKMNPDERLDCSDMDLYSDQMRSKERKEAAMIKLPLKAEKLQSSVCLTDANNDYVGVVGEMYAQLIVSSVNSAGAMREALEEIAKTRSPYPNDFVETCDNCSKMRMIARSALSSAPVDHQKDRMKELLKEIVDLDQSAQAEGELLSGLFRLVVKAAALLSELEGNHGA
jgi:hypothetical protein